MSQPEILEIPSPADFHVHLRQGTMSALVTPHVALGGFKLAYVMVRHCVHHASTVLQTQPNTKPPITTTEQALAYKKELEAIDPNIEFMMTLYLSPDLTPHEIRKAKAAGIAGTHVCGEAGLTTNVIQVLSHIHAV